jgi:hypothetical protein
MAGSAATCAGSFDCDIIGGYLGVYPGTSITGNFAGDIVSTEGAADCAEDGLAAWTNGRALTTGTTMLAEMGGLTFTPGVYIQESSINIALAKPTVYLDAMGDKDAVFIFNAGSTLTTCANSEIVLLNGAQKANIFWILGTALTMGADGILVGNVLAGSAITIGTNGSIMGRAIAQTAVTCESHCYIETNGRHSASPSVAPSDIPSDAPSDSPSDSPSEAPSEVPSDTPSDIPSDAPSDAPSDTPSDAPSDVPSDAPGPTFGWTSGPKGLVFKPIFGDGGTRLPISSSDDSTELVDLGFDFKWLGYDTTVSQVRVSTNGQINIRSDDTDNNCCWVDPIGAYGKPRIAVAQEDLNPRTSGEIATLVKRGVGSIVVSWENVSFYYDQGNVNAQAELFANGAVNICYGEGNMGGQRFSAGIEGGGGSDPYWNGDAVVLPLSDDEHFNSDGITSSWPTNKCYSFTPGAPGNVDI